MNRNQRSRFVTLHLIATTLVALLIILAKLPQNSDADRGIKSDLVPDADGLEAGRFLDGVGVTKEAGKQVLDVLAGLNRADAYVVKCWPRHSLAPWIDIQ